MFYLLETLANGKNGYFKTALIAVVISVTVSVVSAWALDKNDQDRRDRETDKLHKEVATLRETASRLEASLARIEARLAVILEGQERQRPASAPNQE